VGLACQRDYRFDTVARYEAPAGRYRVEIHARGLDRAGADLSHESTATVEFNPSPSSPGHRARLAVRSAAGQTFEVELVGNQPCREADGLAGLLGEWGYSELSADEVAETCWAIEGAIQGPKATLMGGQTRWLRVLETSFQR
jgi:hypothetical protein